LDLADVADVLVADSFPQSVGSDANLKIFKILSFFLFLFFIFLQDHAVFYPTMSMSNTRTSVLETVQLVSGFPFFAIFASRLSSIPFAVSPCSTESGPAYSILDLAGGITR